MEAFKTIYERNKKLDKMYIDRYQNDELYFKEKNCIEFLVELGEFINETKCFKYWTIKEPKHDEVLEEYADCITMCLTFFNLLGLELDKFKEHIESDNVILVINHLFQQGSKLMTEMNEELVKDIFVNLLYVGDLLGLKKDEIINSINKKITKVEERLNSDY